MNIFSKGQRVKKIQSIGKHIGDKEIPIGTIGKVDFVTGYDEFDLFIFKDNKGKRYPSCDSNDYEVIPQFKIGDKVRIIKNLGNRPDLVGYAGIITSIFSNEKNPYRIEMDADAPVFFAKAEEEELELLPQTNSTVEKGCDNKMQNDFKIGDIIEPNDTTLHNGCDNGTKYFREGKAKFVEVTSIDSNKNISGNFLDADKKATGNYSCCRMYAGKFRKVKSAQTLMQKLNTITRKIVSPNIRKFVKAGYLDSCLNLTEDGKEAIFSIWMTQPANEKLLVDEADARIEEMEEEKEKCK